MADSACGKIWQIFGKMVFDDHSPYEGKALIAAYLLIEIGGSDGTRTRDLLRDRQAF
jgi:hypothetical protein